MPQSSSIRHANVIWKEDTPVSTEFDDFYFNDQDGLDESRYVFLEGNALAERFSQQDLEQFTIAETGFGAGLNFLATRELWLKTASDTATLHYISVEKYPISQKDLAQALTHWPELQQGTDRLVEAYPEPIEGFHRISFDNGRIQLTLMLMDAVSAYRQLTAPVDAWFLDGFSPSKNPDMWSEDLLQQVGRLSTADTTLATFTSAGSVRRGLESEGFSIQKVVGFGLKREMVRARCTTPRQTSSSATPWFDQPFPASRPSHVVIIGAGVAGCSTAYALAQRGVTVELIERNAEIALEGSGNQQGALYAKLPVSHNTQGQLHLSGLLYSRTKLQQLDPEQQLWSDCGLLQLATNDKELKRQQSMMQHTSFGHNIVRAVDSQEASTLAGNHITAPGIFMPYGGWVNPRLLCESLIQHPLINLHLNKEVTSLEQTAEGNWQLQLAGDEPLLCSQLVICTAAEAKKLPQLNHLPVKPIRGQTSLTNQAGPALQTVVCGDGYISPALNGQYCFGATFDLHNLSLDIRQDDHRDNLYKLRAVLPELAASIAEDSLEGRAAYRCSTGDYLPITGPAPDYEAYLNDYAKLRTDRKWKFTDTPPQHLKGLYLNIGHGSKGLITGPICGEVVAASILGEPFPIEKLLLDAINPARFIVKNLIRKSI
ncbi:MAG: bifunctional tRNA (5-methylaminomethyl-2-thiouridine)(34)-methyltransferase MnmD/FAD-dependent 5-carboxymethylaminomethyl-2-thiouridine(34) oxidoreductase MnmC [Oceanospirillaceae bacterium]|nr:bifunctional tRNA (5-methylaminomethyl-2-thiouridine)(34)-methyltransferase MnmD/FAD-dependent 5-carboxymethylaminomethyl-2-thiouridine(34) oxidoreductase MnmC [Oceanospirillaceae bacterium]